MNPQFMVMIPLRLALPWTMPFALCMVAVANVLYSIGLCMVAVVNILYSIGLCMVEVALNLDMIGLLHGLQLYQAEFGLHSCMVNFVTGIGLFSMVFIQAPIGLPSMVLIMAEVGLLQSLVNIANKVGLLQSLVNIVHKIGLMVCMVMYQDEIRPGSNYMIVDLDLSVNFHGIWRGEVDLEVESQWVQATAHGRRDQGR